MEMYFEGKSAEEISAIDKQIRILAKRKAALAPVVGRGAHDAIIAASVKDAKENLIPIIGERIGTINGWIREKNNA